MPAPKKHAEDQRRGASGQAVKLSRNECAEIDAIRGELSRANAVMAAVRQYDPEAEAKMLERVKARVAAAVGGA